MFLRAAWIAIAAWALVGPASAQSQSGERPPAPSRVEVHWSLQANLGFWAAELGSTVGLWLHRGSLRTGVHLHGGALRAHYDPAEFGLIAGMIWGYGAQIGFSAGDFLYAPYVLGGYDRFASGSIDAEGGAGGGRTREELNVEAGLTAWKSPTGVPLLVGVKVGFGLRDTAWRPAGPPFPRASLTSTFVF